MTAATDAEPLAAGLSPRRVALIAGVATLTVVSAVLLAPALTDLPSMWDRVTAGDPWWLAAALGFEVLSFAGHILLFRAVAAGSESRIGMREAGLITLAGHAATRLFATAGAGGVVLTAWALRRAGLSREVVAARMTTFLVLLYGVYMAALVVGGVALYAGLLPGSDELALTLLPAALAAAVIGAALLLPRLRLRRTRAIGDGVRDALAMVRARDAGLAGAVMWWAFDVAVLWACFRAFGASPPIAVIVMAYFIGMLANTLPLPGGIGGVDGGMIGALLAFGVAADAAILAVLAYRLFAFWLPIAPGVLAYVGLRRTVAEWEDDAQAEAEAEPVREPATAPARTGRQPRAGEPQLVAA